MDVPNYARPDYARPMRANMFWTADSTSAASISSCNQSEQDIQLMYPHYLHVVWRWRIFTLPVASSLG